MRAGAHQDKELLAVRRIAGMLDQGGVVILARLIEAQAERDCTDWTMYQP
ncbi:MAG: hypothetical protein ACREJM_15150 [Candidatus Saccharimonadales bacterium]